MMRSILLFTLLLILSDAVIAQTREDLERQRKQLKKDIEDAQKLLSSNNTQLKNSLGEIITLGHEIDIRGKVVANLGQDLNILDNNIFTIQKDIIKYDHLLDTLKQEYAKSMIYAYKNKSNYEFLSFIFSADNFNDAIKRVAYLKSYRNYREMQGENILRTQELRKNRLEDLGVSKQEKNTTLDAKSKEVEMLEEKKKQQNEIVVQLKKKGKDINAQIAAKQKQMAKISSAVKAAIARDIKEEDDRRKAVEKAAALAAAAERKSVEEKRVAAITKANTNKPAVTSAAKAPSGVKVNPAMTITGKVAKASSSAKAGNDVPATIPVVKSKPSASVIVSAEANKNSITLSADFKSRIGSFQWPVDGGTIIRHQGNYKLQNGTIVYNDGITIAATLGAPVRTIFSGTVILVLEIEEGTYVITVRHGEYYTTYTNIASPSVKAGQDVATNQAIGKVATNLFGVSSVDFQTAKGKTPVNPENWLHPR